MIYFYINHTDKPVIIEKEKIIYKEKEVVAYKEKDCGDFSKNNNPEKLIEDKEIPTQEEKKSPYPNYLNSLEKELNRKKQIKQENIKNGTLKQKEEIIYNLHQMESKNASEVSKYKDSIIDALSTETNMYVLTEYFFIASNNSSIESMFNYSSLVLNRDDINNAELILQVFGEVLFKERNIDHAGYIENIIISSSMYNKLSEDEVKFVNEEIKEMTNKLKNKEGIFNTN